MAWTYQSPVTHTYNIHLLINFTMYISCNFTQHCAAYRDLNRSVEVWKFGGKILGEIIFLCRDIRVRHRRQIEKMAENIAEQFRISLSLHLVT